MRVCTHSHPTELPTQERQFKNLIHDFGRGVVHDVRGLRLAMQTGFALARNFESVCSPRPHTNQRERERHVTPKGVLRLAKCDASATREGP